jgi:hypothetical protein
MVPNLIRLGGCFDIYEGAKNRPYTLSFSIRAKAPALFISAALSSRLRLRNRCSELV